MPRGKFKSLTTSTKVLKKLSSKDANYLLKKRLEEREALQKLASKITKVPETVRTYTP